MCRYLLFDQVLAPLLVTDGLIRQATAPGRKQQLQNKAQLDARFIRYIRRQVKIPNGLLSFDDFVRVTVVLSTYKKLEMLRLLFNLVRVVPSALPHARVVWLHASANVPVVCVGDMFACVGTRATRDRFTVRQCT